MQERFAEKTAIADLTLERWTTADLEDLQRLITSNVEHLRPRMPWIADEPKTVDERRVDVDEWTRRWENGHEVVMAIRMAGRAVGSAGLHERGWPEGPEIGYWVDARHQGRGVATNASRALVRLAFDLERVDAVHLTHDLTNERSARIPARLGFHRVDQVPAAPDKIAPGDSGILVRWRLPREEWDLSR